MDKSAKRFILAIASVLTVTLLSLLVLIGLPPREPEIDRVLFNKILFAELLEFDFRMMVDGEQFGTDLSRSSLGLMIMNRVRPDPPAFDPFHTDLIFTYTKEEAFSYPDNVITAWPTTQTLRNINELNWSIQNNLNLDMSSDELEIILHDLDGNEFVFEFPVTLTDVVENWEEVRAFHFAELAFSPNMSQGNDPEFVSKLERLTREKYSIDISETIVSVYDIYFAADFGFDFRMVAGDKVVNDPVQVLLRTQGLYPKFFDPFYTDFVLVDTKEEALTYPDNVITAWPSQETQAILIALNWVIKYESDSDDSEIVSYQAADMLEFPFVFPVTIADMTRDREEFSRFWHIFNPGTRDLIMGQASSIREESNSPEFLAELERLKAEREARESD